MNPNDTAPHIPGDPGNERSYTVIGSSPIRADGVDKVTGKALYGNDIRLPEMLYGAVLRSCHAHARLVAIDARKALALPGVTAVITAVDLYDYTGSDERARNLRYQNDNILARTKVLYYGHAIAAVAATTPELAQQAIRLIQVEYELLPPVLDVRQAMQADAPILLNDLRTAGLTEDEPRPSNIAFHQRIVQGDLEQGFRQAVVIVEREFTTSPVHQGYLEPQNATALYNRDGQITIWCSTQGAFGVRDQVAEIIHVPVSKIRVIPMEIGGGFGGKNNVYLEPLAALLSLKSGYRPVKMIMGYDEVLAATGPASGSYIRVRMGADRDGRITAADATLIYESGAYPGMNAISGMVVLFSPYRIPHVRLEGYDVVVNKPRVSSYRAPGGTNAVFAAETVVDELSGKLGLDPVEFRLMNGVKIGDRRSYGGTFPAIGLLETLHAVQDHPHYTAPLVGEYCGRGVAVAYWGNYGGKSSATASVNADGSVNLVTGSVDLGGSRVALAMQLAETLGLRVDKIQPLVGDTATIGYTEGSYGSRTTFATGWAVYELGQSLIRQMTARVARIWEVTPEQVTYEKGVFTSGENKLSFQELAGRLDETGGAVVASAAVRPETEGPAFAVHIVDVAVDPETGKVDILRYTALQDVGRAIHRAAVEGQIQGGVAMGVGWALNEAYYYDEQGRLLNTSLLDYRMPTCLDLPLIEVVIIEEPNPGHPYGVRGVGEAPVLPPPAAIANAIYRAVGVRLTRLPMTPAYVLEEIISA